MNNDIYEKWLLSTTHLITTNMLKDPPNSNTIKQEMINWLNRHEIPVDAKLPKTQIYAIICQHKE
ncbi:Uncharacterized protein OBRU01_26439, partial [Operophtera brumata]